MTKPTPQPRYVAQGHYQTDSSTHTLVAYDQKYDPWHDNWSCTCEGYHFNHSCKHVAALLDMLGVPVISPAHKAVLQAGVTLESLFDYSQPATHAVTNRDKVKAGFRF